MFEKHKSIYYISCNVILQLCWAIATESISNITASQDDTLYQHKQQETNDIYETIGSISLCF